DRNDADSQLAGEAFDHQPVAGLVLAVENRLEDRLVGVVGLRRGGAWPALPVARIVIATSHVMVYPKERSVSWLLLGGRSGPDNGSYMIPGPSLAADHDAYPALGPAGEIAQTAA